MESLNNNKVKIRSGGRIKTVSFPKEIYMSVTDAIENDEASLDESRDGQKMGIYELKFVKTVKIKAEFI